MRVEDRVDRAITKKATVWPHCDNVGGICLGYDLSRRAGRLTFQELLSFIWTAEEGARLTLQKNRDGFSLQVTGGIHRPPIDEMDLAFLRDVRKTLDESDESAERI
jgi:hypothetical protein